MRLLGTMYTPRAMAVGTAGREYNDHFTSVLRVNYRIYGDNAVIAKRRGVGSSISYAALALKPGVRIGPKSPFRGGIIHMEGINPSGRAPRGHWLDVKNRYLGVRFAIKGEIHYGWARLSVRKATPGLTATLTGYVYETIPNKPIPAAQTKGTEDGNTEVPDASLTMPTSEPVTLGALAMGAPGLSIWRRRETVLVGD